MSKGVLAVMLMSRAWRSGHPLGKLTPGVIPVACPGLRLPACAEAVVRMLELCAGLGQDAMETTSSCSRLTATGLYPLTATFDNNELHNGTVWMLSILVGPADS